MEGLRCREKDRVATCVFADEIATLIIDKWKSFCDLRNDTVLAGIIARLPNGELEVISFGCGTKFMRSQDILEDVKGEKLHDSHAEVLSKRSFILALYFDVERILQGEEGLLLRRKGDSRFCLKDSVTIHLYSSSAPCGNSTIRRWSKSVYEKVVLQSSEWPEESHDPLHIVAKQQGQLAASWKRDPAEINGVGDGQVIAPGTLPILSKGRLLCCSDKIALWNAVGLQGGILSNIIDSIYLTTITVGRKYSKFHLQRALCCRLQEMDFSDEGFQLHHPSMLCTSQKLSYDAISQSDQAVFQSTTCYSWSVGDCRLWEVQGDQGTLVQEEERSPICRQNLHSRFNAIFSSLFPLQPSVKHEELKGISDRARQYYAHKQIAKDIMKDLTKPKRKRRRGNP